MVDINNPARIDLIDRDSRRLGVISKVESIDEAYVYGSPNTDMGYIRVQGDQIHKYVADVKSLGDRHLLGYKGLMTISQVYGNDAPYLRPVNTVKFTNYLSDTGHALFTANVREYLLYEQGIGSISLNGVFPVNSGDSVGIILRYAPSLSSGLFVPNIEFMSSKDSYIYIVYRNGLLTHSTNLASSYGMHTNASGFVDLMYYALSHPTEFLYDQTKCILETKISANEKYKFNELLYFNRPTMVYIYFKNYIIGANFWLKVTAGEIY